MIPEASAALEEGRIDSYSVECHAPHYTVTVGVGDDAWFGRGLSEEEGFYMAQQAMSGPPIPRPEPSAPPVLPDPDEVLAEPTGGESASDPSPEGVMDPGEPAAADPSTTGRRRR